MIQGATESGLFYNEHADILERECYGWPPADFSPTATWL